MLLFVWNFVVVTILLIWLYGLSKPMLF
uniref:Uncharacterized protein n=1 Tax=Arundo donax TaxID=35708 RepID=A0A0A9DJ75_ARUDO